MDTYNYCNIDFCRFRIRSDASIICSLNVDTNLISLDNAKENAQ